MLNSVDDGFTATLRGLMPAAAFRDASDSYLTEPRGRWRGQGLVIAPGSTEEVSLLVRACAEARVGLVPYSGGTGLVGGQILTEGPVPVILSLERMNRIRAVHRDEGVMEVDAGVILAHVQEAARDLGLIFPLSLASEGSARIGGLLSTNAGGINTLRYGNARQQCLGLEVVWPDGAVWHGMTRLRKDNTGYDLRNLLIGAEGTLGVITGATLQMQPAPQSVGAAVLAVAGPEAALKLLSLARNAVGNAVSAFELIHRQGFDFLRETGVEARHPFPEPPDWCVLIELGLSGGGEADAALMDLFGAAVEAGLVDDGVIAQSEGDVQAFWHMRESIPEANRRIGAVSSHDISLPLGEIAGFIDAAPDVLAQIGDFRINCFGHLGDGNLHYNVFPAPGRTRADHEAQRDVIKAAVHDLVDARGGSVSAEHGIGRLKVDDLETYAEPAKLTVLRQVKAAIDPLGIMNPGAVLRG